MAPKKAPSLIKSAQKDVQVQPEPENSIVKEQAEEIQKLREVLAIIGSGEGDLRETKILELFKKNRMLNLQLERERTRNNNTRKAMAVIQQELLNMQQARPLDDSSIRQGLEYWVDKYHKTKQQLEVVQASENILQKQIQKLHHIIRREVGDHIPLLKIIEEGSGWVGRSEQVSKLRDKVAELKAQIATLQLTPVPGHNLIQNDETRTIEILHRNNLEKLDNERRCQYDKLVHDFLALRTSWGMQKKRLDGVIARRNTLEKELRGAKTKLGKLFNKSINDDLLIQALTIELAAARKNQKPGGPLQLDHHTRCHKLAASFHELKSQYQEQELTLKYQGEIIQTFHDTIEDPMTDDWCTSAIFQESHASETRFAPDDNNEYDETKDPLLESLA